MFEGEFKNIYKGRCRSYYNHNLFGVIKVDKGSDKKNEDDYDTRLKKESSLLDKKHALLEADINLDKRFNEAIEWARRPKVNFKLSRRELSTRSSGELDPTVYAKALNF